jgi:hypothetical protein
MNDPRVDTPKAKPLAFPGVHEQTGITAIALEVDPQHDAPARGPADLGESGVDEDASAADVELTPDDVLPGLREHRVALEGTRAALASEVNGGAREGTADPAAPEG